MVHINIFVKKQGSNLFSSNGRVKIFSWESRKVFVKKQGSNLFSSNGRVKIFSSKSSPTKPAQGKNRNILCSKTCGIDNIKQEQALFKRSVAGFGRVLII